MPRVARQYLLVGRKLADCGHSHSSVPSLAVCPKSIEVLSVVAFHRFAVCSCRALLPETGSSCVAAAGGGGAPACHEKRLRTNKKDILLKQQQTPSILFILRAARPHGLATL